MVCKAKAVRTAGACGREGLAQLQATAETVARAAQAGQHEEAPAGVPRPASAASRTAASRTAQAPT
jgi:hypothetical protein